jgi:hypothetical protein
MKAYVEGIHYYKTHRAESLAILAKYLRTSETDVLTEVYEDVGLRLTGEKPFPTLRGIGIMLAGAGCNQSQNHGRSGLRSIVDLTFIKELDGSDFIDRLYKTTVSRGEPRRATLYTPANISGNSAPGTERTKAIVGMTKSGVPFGFSNGASEHTVAPGDTLSLIARKYYGTQLNWEKIYQANKSTMKHPDYIYVGQKIIIPS